jgi:chromodomain-helicase-DNA-binding protein 4
MDGVDFVPLPFKDGKNSLSDKAASSGLANSLHKFEAVCEDISRILRSHENGTTPKEEVMLDASSKETASPQDPGAQPTADVPSSSSK